MAFLQRVLRRPPRLAHRLASPRTYTTKPSASPAPAAAAASSGAPVSDEAESETRSMCPPNTVLEGLNYLKGQPPVLALPDEEYPPWLWDLLKPKELPDDGPGGRAEKVRLRRENRQRIRDQNFMKTQ